MGPGGIIISLGETTPTLAGAETLLDSTMDLTSEIGLSEKMNPTFSFNKDFKESNSGMAVFPPLASFKKATNSSS